MRLVFRAACGCLLSHLWARRGDYPKRCKPAEVPESKPSIEQLAESEPPCEFDWPQAAHGCDADCTWRVQRSRLNSQG